MYLGVVICRNKLFKYVDFGLWEILKKKQKKKTWKHCERILAESSGPPRKHMQYIKWKPICLLIWFYKINPHSEYFI